MKTRKSYYMALLPVVFLLLIFCIGKGIAKDGPMAPEVRVLTCLPSFAGSESISLTSNFTISNPNNALISIDFDYQLEAENQLLGKSMIPTVYVPPKHTIEVKNSIVIPFKGWFASIVISGKSKKEAVMIIAPLWKGLGGMRPAALPEALWDKIPAKNPAMKAKCSLAVNTEAGQSMFYVNKCWQY